MDYNPDAYDILIAPPGPFHVTLAGMIEQIWTTQLNFARAGGFSPVQVSRWCTGANRPGEESYRRIERLVAEAIEAGGVERPTVERVVNRLRVSYYAPDAGRQREVSVETRALRVLNDVGALYPDAVGDAFADGLYSLHTLLAKAYQAGYEAGRRDALELTTPRKPGDG